MAYRSKSAAGEQSAYTEIAALVISSRFRGPDQSANGGYMCGRVAKYLDSPATVTLRQPPPLETAMSVEANAEGSVLITQEGMLMAEATYAEDGPALEVPGTVSPAEAHAAEGGARYFQNPAFPSCFVCGKERDPGDGLRIFPGPLSRRSMWAAPWTPDASLANGDRTVRSEFAWAALDCPSGIAAAAASDLDENTAVLLGRMTANVAVLPTVGEECVAVGWLIGRDGRKLTAGSALLASGGEVLAGARTGWVTVPRQVPGTEAT